MGRRSYSYDNNVVWDYIFDLVDGSCTDRSGYGLPAKYSSSWVKQQGNIEGKSGILMNQTGCGYLIPIPIAKTRSVCTEFTMEIDYVSFGEANYNNLYDCYHAHSNGYNFQYVDTGWPVYLGKGVAEENKVFISKGIIPKNTWLVYRLTVSQSAKTAKWEIFRLAEGSIVYSHTAPIQASYTEGTYGNIYLGNCIYYTDRYLNGLISGFRFRKG